MPEERLGRAQLRASDADRDAALAELREHGAEGRLDLDELNERIGAVLGARTLGELDALLADLPSPGAARIAPATSESARRPAWTRRVILQAAAFDAAVLVAWGIGGVHGDGGVPILTLLLSVVLTLRRLRRGPRPAGYVRYYDGRLPPG